MSSGRPSTTGPGRPEVASWKARLTNSGMRSARSISATHFATSPKNALKSISWKASRSRMWRATWPRSRIIGVESCRADMEPGRGVGGARAARRHDDAGPAGELAPGLGRHRRAALLAAGGDPDRRIVERVEQREVAFAGHAEGAARRRSDAGHRPESGRRCGWRSWSSGHVGKARGTAGRDRSRAGSCRTNFEASREGRRRLGVHRCHPLFVIPAKAGVYRSASLLARRGVPASPSSMDPGFRRDDRWSRLDGRCRSPASSLTGTNDIRRTTGFRIRHRPRGLQPTGSPG